MSRAFDRRREEVIQYLVARLTAANDSRAESMVLRYCRIHAIPATDRDITDIANEAIRRRMIARILQLGDQLQQLAVVVSNQAGQISALQNNMQTARDQFLALKARVDTYHP